MVEGLDYAKSEDFFAIMDYFNRNKVYAERNVHNLLLEAVKLWTYNTFPELNWIIGLLSEEFRMRAETDKVYLIGVRVKPYQQKVAFNMAFHISCIVAGKHVWIIFRRNLSFRLKHIEDSHKLSQLIGIITEALVVLFVLGGGV